MACAARFGKIIRVCMAALLLTPCAAAVADEAGEQPGHRSSNQPNYHRIEEFLAGLQGLQAQFRQTLTDSKGRVTGQSSGVLSIRRPNRFRWDYREPNEQLIVADGTRIWLYDKDLEQVTVRRVDQSLSATPAMLLSGEGSLEDNFSITGGERQAAVDWVMLEPKRDDTDFKWVRLGLDGQVLKYMQLADKLGQITTLEFTGFERNPPLDPAQFAFKVPPGADVIGDASGAVPPAPAH